MNLDKTEIEKITEICLQNDISFCGLFGSFARGEGNSASDIDLLVRFSKPKGYDFLDAAFEIEEALGKKVDLITEAGLSKHVREYVYKDLQVLYGERQQNIPA